MAKLALIHDHFLRCLDRILCRIKSFQQVLNKILSFSWWFLSLESFKFLLVGRKSLIVSILLLFDFFFRENLELSIKIVETIIHILGLGNSGQWTLCLWLISIFEALNSHELSSWIIDCACTFQGNWLGNSWRLVAGKFVCNSWLKLLGLSNWLLSSFDVIFGESTSIVDTFVKIILLWRAQRLLALEILRWTNRLLAFQIFRWAERLLTLQVFAWANWFLWCIFIQLGLTLSACTRLVKRLILWFIDIQCTFGPSKPWLRSIYIQLAALFWCINIHLTTWFLLLTCNFRRWCAFLWRRWILWLRLHIWAFRGRFTSWFCIFCLKIFLESCKLVGFLIWACRCFANWLGIYILLRFSNVDLSNTFLRSTGIKSGTCIRLSSILGRTDTLLWTCKTLLWRIFVQTTWLCHTHVWSLFGHCCLRHFLFLY